MLVLNAVGPTSKAETRLVLMYSIAVLRGSPSLVFSVDHFTLLASETVPSSLGGLAA
mgnify:CR=1 FL=1